MGKIFDEIVGELKEIHEAICNTQIRYEGNEDGYMLGFTRVMDNGKIDALIFGRQGDKSKFFSGIMENKKFVEYKQ